MPVSDIRIWNINRNFRLIAILAATTTDKMKSHFTINAASDREKVPD